MRKGLFAAKHTFAIFSAPHISIITFADCTTSAVVAFGVLMASVSVAWVIFCEGIGQRIHCMLLILIQRQGWIQGFVDYGHCTT